MTSIVPFIFGAVVGSFLNVCIHRIPVGESIVRPPSRCPSCKRGIPFYHNIPVLSYFILGGRCSSCGQRFSIRYPFVEALSGVFAVALYSRYGLSAEVFLYFAFISALVVITFIDLDWRIIPDRISIPGIAVGLVSSYFLPYPGFINSVIGALAGGGVLLGIAAAYYFMTGTEGMGGGDVKLLAMAGAFLGWEGVLVTLLVGSFTGAAVGAFFMAVYGKSGKYAIPFGPFLAAGAAFYLFFGDALVTWYFAKSFGM